MGKCFGRDPGLKRVKNTVIDECYSYNNVKIVYPSFQSDPRWSQHVEATYRHAGYFQ